MNWFEVFLFLIVPPFSSWKTSIHQQNTQKSSQVFSVCMQTVLSTLQWVTLLVNVNNIFGSSTVSLVCLLTSLRFQFEWTTFKTKLVKTYIRNWVSIYQVSQKKGIGSLWPKILSDIFFGPTFRTSSKTAPALLEAARRWWL